MEFGIVPKQAPSPAEVALNATPTDFVHPAQTQFQFFESRHTFEDHPVFLQIMCMANSYFVWVGTIPPVMGLVELCMPGKVRKASITKSSLNSSFLTMLPHFCALDEGCWTGVDDFDWELVIHGWPEHSHKAECVLVTVTFKQRLNIYVPFHTTDSQQEPRTAVESKITNSSLFGYPCLKTFVYSATVQKTGASVMVSYNISETIPNIKEFVEVKIFESLKANQAK
jgi:hypothetical protein